MKLRFEPNLDFQLQAVEAVCDLFRGQDVCRTEFTVTHDQADGHQQRLEYAQHEIGVGNRLQLLDEEIHENLKEIQLRNGLAPSDRLESGDFTVEMETGTGKTYVYLRTVFELSKRYGFTKFVVVVPSVAIKEGVYKTLQITEDHFRTLYSGTPFEYFIYDSAKLGQVRNFATSPQIQIMVVTVGAINKKEVNNLYKDSEKTGGEKPIDLVKATRPILIVDEPQSVDGGLQGQGKKALDEMNALCTLRYSATHVDKYHMVYRLHAVDAYQRKLVKQIEVASATVEHAHNRPYVRLISTSNKHGVSARLEMDVDWAGGVQRMARTVQDGDDLEQETGRAVYRDCRVGEIRAAKGQELVELRTPNEECWLRLGEAFGDVDASSIHRQMIRRTIREHLDKEKRLRPQGIKVLSLFFVDAVKKYRLWDSDGDPLKGPYAEMFEEEYRRLARHPDYSTLFQEVDLDRAAAEVHDGYFSMDRKGGWLDTAENNIANRENAERAYSLIMKDKERLLSLDEPLKFIFSHSALREGWDNPNVFQICALRDIQTERERRQTIGRGLRLCVNQEGVRLHGFDVNTLTVVAGESYEDFADNLQREIEEDTGIRFGVIEAHDFARVQVAEGGDERLGLEASRALYKFLAENGHIDARGRVQDSLRKALRDGTLELPGEFTEQREDIIAVLEKRAGRLEIADADKRGKARLRPAVLADANFNALWDRIKHRTTYRVDFDNDALIKDCTDALAKAPPIPRTRLQWRKADIEIGEGGVDASETESQSPVAIDESAIELPDILTELQDRTQLTRRTIHRVLVDSGRLGDFRRNPQLFIELAAKAINHRKQQALTDGIRYRRLKDSSFSAQELFEPEVQGYLRNMIDCDKSLYDKVVFESQVEREFADQLDKNTDVEVFAKLPSWFKVATPLGSYNPDWALTLRSAEGEHRYFVVETKGTPLIDALRKTEAGKITCGREHFKALEVRDKVVKYRVASSVDDLMADE